MASRHMEHPLLPLLNDHASALDRQFAFIVEIDRLKGVLRQNSLADRSRRENSAEHSWHVALLALTLNEYAALPIDVGHVIRLLLIHDLVEIDAGDTFAYDAHAQASQQQREQAACERIFGLLPPAQAEYFQTLWAEFDAGETPEARYALAVDRLMPMIHNALTEGSAWRANGVVADQVRRRAESITRGAPELGALASRLIDASVKAGYLPDPKEALKE